MILTIYSDKMSMIVFSSLVSRVPSAPQEILRVVGAEREGPGGGGAAQQAGQRGSVLRRLQQNADAVRAAGLGRGHAGQK